jgi:hypothetical protein
LSPHPPQRNKCVLIRFIILGWIFQLVYCVFVVVFVFVVVVVVVVVVGVR